MIGKPSIDQKRWKFMIYFDNSATTKPYPEAVDAFVKVSSEYYGNPSSLHGIGGKAEKLLSHARGQIAGLLGAKQQELYFTSGGTESNNLAIKGAALMYKRRGRHLITTAIEHDSVKKAMEQLEQLGYEVTYLPVGHNGIVQIEDVQKAIRDDTILISIMYVNNETGSIQPVEEIGQLLKRYPNVVFHVDAVQAVGKLPIRLSNSGIDLCSISAHKFHGLKGTGALFIRDGLRLAPLLSGGGQEAGMRSGTENVAGAVAMAKALRVTMENFATGISQMTKVHKILRDGLQDMPNIQIHTPEVQAAPHILNFSVSSLRAETLIHALEEQDIYVSTTSACSSKRHQPSRILLAMGVPENLAGSAIRISLSEANTEEEAMKFLAELKQAVNQLGKVRK